MSGWIDPDRMTNDYTTFDAFPSRAGHRVIIHKNTSGGTLELEVIAWQVCTDNKTGAVDVYPITEHGVIYNSQIVRRIQPNFKQASTRQFV